jgi:hypothetical protein
VLVFTGFRGGLATVELPDGDPRPLALPEGPSYVLAGYFLNDGSVVAVVERGFERVGAFRLGPDERPVALGGPLRGTFTFSFAGGVLLAARCDARPAAYLLDVTSTAGWERVEGACGATLSPDGDTLVWTPDGRTVLRAATDGRADPETILDVTQIAGLPPGVAEEPEIIGELRWSRDGLAIPLGSSERQAAAVVGLEGDVDVTPLGERGAGIGSILAWQPEGELLAAGSWSNLEAVVRVFPVGSEDARVVAILPEQVAGLVWSPNGDVLLAASQSNWTFVTPEGAWVRSIPVRRGDSLPLAWRSG